MILNIEIVPRTTWHENVRSKIPKTQWDKIKKKTYADSDYKCGICGTSGQLDCHEIWEYDDIKHIQILKGFMILCSKCHRVKHIGLASIKAKEGAIDYDDIVSHFCKVNKCSKTDFYDHKKKAFEKWEKRNLYRWEIDMSWAINRMVEKQ